MTTIQRHEVALEQREGVRGPYPAPSYRWACSCGLAGRWTRQHDTAAEGKRRHSVLHAVPAARVDLRIDVADFSRVFAAAAAAMARSFELVRRQVMTAGRQIAAAFTGIRRIARASDIARHGPGNETADGVWLSDVCAAWVHDSCPSRFCDCSCHGGAS